MGRDDNHLCPICYLNTDIKVDNNDNNLTEKQKLIKEQKEQQREEQNIEIQMKVYAKKLERLKLRLKQRDQIYERSKQTKDVQLSLAPGQKSIIYGMSRSIPMDMHVPVANWQLQFDTNRRKACVIEID